MTTKVDVANAQQKFNEWLSRARLGAEVIIMENDTPVARLTGIAAPAFGERVSGLHRGAVEVSDDFDEPLPDDFWTGAA